MSPVLAVTVLVALQRLTELVIARRNTSRLVAQGAVEHGAGHYPLIVLLHAAWLVSLPFAVPADRWPDPWLLGAYLLLQPARYWCIASLDGHWTTRILVVPGTSPVRRGPYRWLRHPNYLVVAVEIALLPLAFGAWFTALLYSALNGALLLGLRIPCEARAWAGLDGQPG